MRILVAMSGGVDSSVAAALLRTDGHEVIGVTMRLADEDPSLRPTGAAERGCCGVRAIEDARRVCARLGIPHYPLDFWEAMESEVIAEFCAEYARGRTPNPCIRCNDILKFHILLGRLAEFKADRLATGHYARIVPVNGSFQLRRAADRRRDQSYFLYRFTQEQLARVILPLGELTKDEVRAQAGSLGLPVADKPDSQEICFVPGDDYPIFLRKRRPGLFRPGPVKDETGCELGRHNGIAGFTIGQRKGLGLPLGERRYVVRLEPETATVVLGPESSAYGTTAELEAVTWVAGCPPAERFRARVRIRNQHPAAPALVHVEPDRSLVTFDRPQWALTPGQAAVCYDDDRVLGGGTIARTGNARPAARVTGN
ncbi:MAG TPA: tRNA 2-thiouridine(34) synthase MnmA [candidate division WOR-3 bacterium]|uniref:tRNA-specific 2-thiouridylase MnmA n=1 Tax=candidate division WOR-3 bacterium TaxID=2052148 RepID=A0A7V0XE73_UNCW3|nr:tRNA 2-thiouridine(34) synthase MnmA [candidate division WOR-3 bacterium]